MIAQLGKHLRQWLLELALAARNQAQAVIAKMESVEAEPAKGADREAAPGVAKATRSGQPPAHWVKLVKRHAPELLHPGPPYAAPQASSQVFETDAGGDESGGANTQDPPSASGAIDAGEAQTHEDPTFSFKFLRLSREPGDPPGRWPQPDEIRKSSDSDRPPETAAKRPRVDAEPHAPESVNVHRIAASAAGAENTTAGRFLSLQPKAGSVDSRVPGPGTRQAETPVARASAARRPPSAAGHIEKHRPSKRESQNIRPDAGENFQPPSQTGKDVGSFGRQAENRQAGFQTIAGTPALPVLKQEGAYEKDARPKESSKGRPSLSNSEVKTSGPPVERRGDDRRHVKEVRLIDSRRPGRPAEQRVNGAEKRSRPPEFHWPNLPGEKTSVDAGDSNLSATWPSLPEAQSAAAESLWHQTETLPSEAGSRNIERLRRLDEEQRGISWSASHF
jgi:hypothetical protein